VAAPATAGADTDNKAAAPRAGSAVKIVRKVMGEASFGRGQAP